MSPIYKIVNQDDTPLYQISKPNPNAEFWTMFYFKYAGHQIPPRRIEVGTRETLWCGGKLTGFAVWKSREEPGGEGRWDEDHDHGKERG